MIDKLGKTVGILFVFIMLLSLAVATEPAVSSSNPALEYKGQRIDGRWLGSYKTAAPKYHAYCIDGFKGWPETEGINYTTTTNKSFNSAYILWRYAKNPSDTTSAAISWMMHFTKTKDNPYNDLPHHNINGYYDIPKSKLPNAISKSVDEMMASAKKNAGPYKLKLISQNKVQSGKNGKGSVRLFARYKHGKKVVSDAAGQKIKITVSGGKFGNGTTTKEVSAAGVSPFTFKANKNSKKITFTASVDYAPTQIVIMKPSNRSDIQRVVRGTPDAKYSDSASTKVGTTTVHDVAAIQLLKLGKQADGNLTPLEGAIFGLSLKKEAGVEDIMDSQETLENGTIEFEDLAVKTQYYVHELTAPDGYKKTNRVYPVKTGGDGSITKVKVDGEEGIINEPTIFDLALRKYIHAVNGTVTGQDGTEKNVAPTEVRTGDVVQHRVVVYNQGETAGGAETIIDYLPYGYDFIEELNQDWTYNEVDRTVSINASDKELAADPTPGKINGDEPSFFVDLYLKVNSRIYSGEGSDFGKNFAEICTDFNEPGYTDIDSTPDCDKNNDKVGGDNIVDEDGKKGGDEDDHDYDDIAPAPIKASTKATDFATVGKGIKDTLTTETSMPGGLKVVFTAYDNDQCSGDPVHTSNAIDTMEGINTVEDVKEFTPDKAGQYYWIAVISNSSGKEFYRGKCGDPGEISTVFKITTKATPDVQIGGKIKDTAFVEGNLPDGSSIVFKLYGPNDDKCTSTPSFISKNIPTNGSQTEYESEETQPVKPGMYHWIEELVDDKGKVITSGECGAENENSSVWDISTNATVKVLLGEEIYDTANVEGAVPEGAKVRFNLYGPNDSECSKPVFVSKEIPVSEAGYYKSEKYTPEKAGEYYWIEELLNKDGEVIGKGTCGIENETTTVTEEYNVPNPDEPETPFTEEPTPDSPTVNNPIPVTG